MRKLILIATVLCCALSPLVLNVELSRVLFKATVEDFVPTTGDEVNNWIEINNFVSHGLEVGKSGFDELLSISERFDIVKYGATHSLFLPLYMGLLAKCFGWGFSSPIYYNCAFLAVGFLLFAFLARINLLQALFGLVFFSTFGPILLYSHSAMVEGPHYLAACILAGLISVLLRDDIKDRQKFFILTSIWLIIFAISLLRTNWGLLFIPLSLYGVEKTWKSYMLRLVAAFAFFVFSDFAYKFFTAPCPFLPYEHGIFGASAWKEFVRGNYHPVVNLFINNMGGLSKTNYFNTYLICILGTWLLLPLIVLARDKREGLSFENRAWVSLFMIISLVLMVTSSTLYYYIYSAFGYKIFSSMFVLMLLVALTQCRTVYLVPILLFNVILLPGTVESLYTWAFPSTALGSELRREVEYFRDAINNNIYYIPKASQWCNTVMVFDIPYQLLALPAGVSHNYTRTTEIENRIVPYKSRYMLVPSVEILTRLEKLNRLKFITSTPVGDLYINLDSPCPSDS